MIIDVQVIGVLHLTDTADIELKADRRQKENIEGRGNAERARE